MLSIVKPQDVVINSPVEKGATLLDAQFPKWEHKVDPEILNVAHAALCPLGQLYGTSEIGCRVLGGDTRDFLVGNGFAATALGGYERNVAAMNAAWRAAIYQRRH